MNIVFHVVGHGASATTTTTSAKVASFSLFDQLQGGFAPPVTLEEIQEAPTAEERLKVLGTIAFIDDLVMEWSGIAPLLKIDLLSHSPAIALDVVAMHRKWFDQGRSSSEYTPLLYRLCQNLLEALVDKILHPACDCSGENSEDECRLVVSLVQNWRDMWLDLMQRGQYCEDLADEMEVCMLLVFLRCVGSTGDSNLSWSNVAQESLAMIDTPSRWFQSWTDHVASNRQLCSLLNTTTMLLPDLWARIQSFPITTDPSVFALELQAISILSITLSRTRVSQFPWGALKGASPPRPVSHEELRNWKHLAEEHKNRDLPYSPSSGPSASSSASRSPSPTPAREEGPRCMEKNVSNEVIPELVDKMLDLFLSAMTYLPVQSNADLESVLLNGIESVLWGCLAGKLDYDHFLRKVTATLGARAASGDTMATHFLEARLPYHNQTAER